MSFRCVLLIHNMRNIFFTLFLLSSLLSAKSFHEKKIDSSREKSGLPLLNEPNSEGCGIDINNQTSLDVMV
jgi:hypothetical protein